MRRLPIAADSNRLASAIGSVASHFSDEPASLPLLTLGSPEYRKRFDEAVEVVGRWSPVHTSRLEELNYDPAAIAAEYAGTGPRFVPREVVRRARARTRRNGLVAAALGILCLGAAAYMDILDLRSEIGAVRHARASIVAPVADAMVLREAALGSASTLVSLDELRLSTPRWTAVLTSLSDATPREAYVQGLRAVDDSVYLDIDGPDAAAVVESLRRLPWWNGVRTVSSVDTELDEAGGIRERVTVAGEVSWSVFNDAEGRSP